MRQQGTCNITPYPHLQCRLQPPRHLVMDLWPLSFLRCMCMHVQRKRMKPTRSHVNNTKQTMQHSKRSHRSWHRREHRWSSAWCFERRVAESGLTCASAISCKSHYMCFHSICYIKESIYMYAQSQTNTALFCHFCRGGAVARHRNEKKGESNEVAGVGEV